MNDLIVEANRYSSFVSLSATILSSSTIEKKDDLGLQLNLIKSSKDLDSDKTKLLQEIYLYSLKNNSFHTVCSSFNRLELSKPLLSSHSNSKLCSITINVLENKKLILEIKSRNSLKRLDVSKIHGDVISEGIFGGMSWSNDDKYFSYVAKPISHSSQTKPIFSFDSVLSNKDSNSDYYLYQEDWGEKFEGLVNTVIVIVDIITGVVQLLPITDKDKVLGQPLLISDSINNYSLVVTAWSTKPRKLGMIYCYQRPSELTLFNLTDFFNGQQNQIVSKSLTSTLFLARSPRYNHNNNILVFIGRKDVMNTHNGCMELYMINNVTSMYNVSVQCLIPLVYDYVSFPGLFVDQLPSKCFINNDTILINTQQGSKETIVSFNIISKEFDTLSNRFNDCQISKWNNKNDNSFFYLDSVDEFILYRESNLYSPHSIGIYNTLTNENVKYNVLSPIVSSCYTFDYDLVENFNNSLIFKIFGYNKNNISFESILLISKEVLLSRQSIPLIVVPHGGPHSSITTNYNPSYNYLISTLNCGLVIINFRGSIGYGEDSILSLLGKIGSNDVEDIYTVVTHMLSLDYNDIKDSTAEIDFSVNTKLFDRSKLGIVGGSHGGFLTAHMIGQYPDLFAAACMRNPVTNIPAMFASSDIPDWCLVETDLPYNFKEFNLPTSNELEIMRQCSPIVYVDKVRTPTLICLGLKDRRVPPSQGKEYYHLLQSRNIESKLVTFPDDCHAIDKPATEGEHWIEIALWLKKYLITY